MYIHIRLRDPDKLPSRLEIHPPTGIQTAILLQDPVCFEKIAFKIENLLREIHLYENYHSARKISTCLHKYVNNDIDSIQILFLLMHAKRRGGSKSCNYGRDMQIWTVLIIEDAP